MKLRSLFIVTSLLLGVSAQADSKLDQMISPVSNPVNFEDPRMNTEARLIYMYHELDDNFVTQGGDIRLYALQLRYAVNDDLALIATKDGYIDFNPNAGLSDDEGFANVALGAKYAFHRDDAAGTIFSGGLRYEAPIGDEEVFQGEGDGNINPFVTGAVALQNLNLMAATGFRLPLDSDDSTLYDLDIHIDAPLGNFYPSVEFNLVHVVDAGNRIGLGGEGADLINFGSSNSDGETLVTTAVGGRYRINDDLDFGVAYQVPLTNGPGSDIFDWRLTTDLIFSFN